MGIGVREARRELSALIKRAEQGGEVRMGPRGSDSATLIGTEALDTMRRRLDRLEAERTVQAPADAPPFARLQDALESGQFTEDGAERRRRRIPALRNESGISREEQERIGARVEREPRYRRSAPRA